MGKASGNRGFHAEKGRGGVPITDSERAGKEPRRALLAWLAVVVALEALLLPAALLSGAFAHGSDLPALRARPILTVVVLLAVASLLHVAAVILAWRWRPPASWIVVLGAVLFRLTLLPTHPIQEDDTYRYLWDGKVVAAGMDPYEFSPLEIREHGEGGNSPPGEPEAARRLEALEGLRNASPENRIILARVNHPGHSTIYPPAAQMAFAVVGIALPHELPVHLQVVAMKAWMTAFDGGAILLLMLLLRASGRPPGLALAWAWCPLVIKEFANSGHMDSIPVFFLLLAVLAAVRGRSVVSGLALGIAILAKFYAAAVAPFLLLLLWRNGAREGAGTAGRLRRTGLTLGVTLTVVGIAALAHPGSAGARWNVLEEFFLHWDNHGALYLWTRTAVASLVPEAVLDEAPAGLLSRGLLAAVVGLITAGHFLVECRAGASSPSTILARIFAVLASLFILSPLGFPWYFTWCIPFLPWARRRSWFLLPGFLFVYYIRFWYLYHRPEGVAFYDEVIVSLEFGIFFLIWAAEGAFLWRRAGGRG